MNKDALTLSKKGKILRLIRLQSAGLTVTMLAFTFFAGLTHAETPALIEAARQQDAAVVKQLLNAGAEPDAQQADGATALHWATYHEDSELLGALIEAGASVNIVNRLGASALYLAAKSGNAGLIEDLLDAGANPNLALKIGETPLMTAARSGTVEGVRSLIEAGAGVNVKENSRGQTALMWAAAQGHVEVARALIDAGADLEARAKVRSRLMYMDATNGGAFDQGVIELLGGFSPLLFAAREGHVEMGRLFLDAGADIEGVAGNGASPLVIATHSGQPNFAGLLLEQGADADAIGAGYSALHAAVLRGDRDTVAALLEHGATTDVRLQKAHPVQRASEDWALKTNLIGATPYWIAASFREAEIMRLLADHGADPLLTNGEIWSRPRARKDRDAYTPTAVGGFESAVQAAVKGDSTRQRYYILPNPDPAGEEQLALAAVKVAADKGVNLNHSDFGQSTALHDAAARALPNIVRELAERGADLNALNGRGLTPLDLALAAESRPNFFGFDLSIPGPLTSEILKEFGAVSSRR